MTFTATGTIEGRPAEVTWSDGELLGDSDAIRKLRESSARAEEEEEPVGYLTATFENHLADPFSAHYLMAGRVFDERPSFSGEQPRYPPIPAYVTERNAANFAERGYGVPIPDRKRSAANVLAKP